MSYICSTGIGIPQHDINQQEIKKIVTEIFTYTDKQVNRLLPVFDNAAVNNRQFVVGKEWFKEDHTFQDRNDLYQSLAKKYALEAMDDCLTNSLFLTRNIPYEAIDIIIFVSSTGIATPSMDVHLMNERPFRHDVNRMPLWGLGCAGGAIGLARAHDWITAHPDKTALIICCELCSLTFQKGDLKKSNIIGTAIFGDGVSAALVIGENSPFLSYRKKVTPKIICTNSSTKRNSTDVMGWEVTDSGFEVIFSKSIPALVNTFWRDHINNFLQENQLHYDGIQSFIAHPGGKKVLEAMKDVLNCSNHKLDNAYKVLANHGNMSSATVIYVLQEAMKENMEPNKRSILSALGPGFCSELLLLEWK